MCSVVILTQCIFGLVAPDLSDGGPGLTPPPSLRVCRRAFVLSEREALAPEVARPGESVLWVSWVSFTMTLVCYWRLGGGVGGGLNGKSKWWDVARDDHGGRGVTVAGQEACGV